MFLWIALFISYYIMKNKMETIYIQIEWSKHLMLEIDYEIGWVSMFSGSHNERWIYCYIRSVTKWLHWTEEFSMFWTDKDFKFLIKWLERKNRKALEDAYNSLLKFVETEWKDRILQAYNSWDSIFFIKWLRKLIR